MIVKCPDCDKVLDLTGYSVTEIIECPDCGLELEVIMKDGKLIVKELELNGKEDWGE